MANAAEVPSEPIVISAAGDTGSVADDSAESECTCGHEHEELPQEAQVILQARMVVDAEPESFAHEQKPFLGFEVDAGIHTLIENLWLMGLPTDFSCQGHLELCHPMLLSSDYFAQVMFLRVSDALTFYSILTDLFGAGTIFGPEGFQLTAAEGEFNDLLEEGKDPDLDFIRATNARARGEVIFHPGYLAPLIDFLDGVTSSQELDSKRALLQVAEDLDEAYEVLGADADTRRLAELDCDCGEEH